MRITWTAGSGNGSIVIVRAGSAPTAGPTDGTEHPDNTQYANPGAEIGTGNYVVYRGSATQVDITGLTADTFYYVDIYEYAGSAALINYQQDAPDQDNAQSGPAPVIPTLTTPLASSIEAVTATLGATITNDGGGLLTARGTVWDTSANPTGNSQAEGGTVVEAFSHSRSIPSLQGTLIYFAGYATNSAGTAYSPDGSFYTEPTQASAIGFESITETSMRVTWTPGTGGPTVGSIVIARQDNAVDFEPADGTEYTANSSFESGTPRGPSNDNYVLYANTGDPFVDITNLTTGTTYYFKVYAYAGSAAAINYDQDSPTADNQMTSGGVAPPVLSTPTVSNINIATATLGATIDSNGGASIIARGTVWDTTASPTANSSAEGGTVVEPFSHNRSIPSLEGTLIYYAGYATNSAGTGYSPDGSFYTEPTQASTADIPGVTSSTMRVTWTPGTGGPTLGSIVIARQAAAVNFIPADDSEYTADASFGSGAGLGAGSDNYVLYIGASNSVNVSNLTAQTQYFIDIYSYAGTSTLINYQQDAQPSANTTTTATPTGHNSTNSVECLECHALHSDLVPRDASQSDACKTCHRVGGEAAAVADVNNHATSKGTVDCGSCHEVHNGYDFSTTSSHPSGTTMDNLNLIRWDLTKYEPNANNMPVFHDPCFPAFEEEPWDGICQSCHTTTKYHRKDNSGGNHTHPAERGDYTGQACTGCHGHSSGFAPQIDAGANCLDADCHGGTTLTPRDVSLDFSMAYHHVGGAGPIENDDCKVCHMESDSLHYNGFVDLKNPDTGAVISVSIPVAGGGITRNRSSNSLESDAVAIQNEFCLKCHDSDGATASHKSGNPLRPFVNNADVNVPNIFDQFDPNNEQFHPVRAAANNNHSTSTAANGNNTTMEPPWNQASNHDMITCFDCHETNGHGAPYQRMVIDSINFDGLEGGAIATEQQPIIDFCTRCHQTAVYIDSRGPEDIGSAFAWHAKGQAGHGANNDQACYACHSGVGDWGSGSPTGAARGNTHGTSFTWPGTTNYTETQNKPTKFFMVGGYITEYWADEAGAQIYCAGCNHAGGRSESRF